MLPDLCEPWTHRKEAEAMTTLESIESLPREQTPLPVGIPFLTAAWRHLVMLSFDIEPKVLEPYVPRGVELDLYEGRALASIVAFQFEDARCYGIPAPFCSCVPEVNLRIYVQREVNGRRRPGVVFLKEIAPRRAISIATVANRCYHEHYQLLPMRHTITKCENHDDNRKSYSYSLKFKGQWNTVDATAYGDPHRPHPDSEEAFVVDHWFAYTKQPDGSCVERQVAHAPWIIRAVDRESLRFRCDIARLYGQPLAAALSQPPSSALVSSGSPVGVFRGKRVGASE
jgi:uncharacterized protein YqjF (DUF2071 family)